MKSALNQWLKENVDFRGLLACGLRHTDKSCFSQTNQDHLPPATLDKAWRALGETLQAVQPLKLSPARLRWVFDQGILHCIIRTDGAFLGLITAKNPAELDAVALERVVAEFQESRV
jgi:hypothetical protein